MSEPTPRDRLERLLADPPPSVNGIDFVEVTNAAQTALSVHFLNRVAVQGSLSGPRPVTIRGGQRIAEVPAMIAGWRADAEQRPILDLTVDAPGDFSTYTLAIDSATLDPFFAAAAFSFKALCDSTLDCEPAPHVCPPPSGDAPPIDYLAKDFLSFKQALSDFSALRYPEWAERSEADFGVMFLEALCKIADDLSYLQDRISWEATLETATQRRSIVRHARMVDYEPRPAVTSSVLLQFDVPPAVTNIPSGVAVLATAPDGSTIPFETGFGLRDTTQYAVSSALNRSELLRVYYRDDSERCLRAGATEMRIAGNVTIFKDTALLIDTRATIDADPPLREVVHLAADASHAHDDLFGIDFTRVRWSDDEALRFDHDVTVDVNGDSRTLIAGNLVPAAQGKRVEELFAIDVAPSAATPLAVVREARSLYTLAQAPLAWQAARTPDAAPLPEIELQAQSTSAQPWSWKRRLLDAGPGERAFTVEPYRLRRIAATPGGAPFFEYDGDGGETIRFGDGAFGAIPDAATLFRATYRVGSGGRGNVAADSITRVDVTSGMAGLVVTNPFAATGGADAEPNERVRRLAPHAFRAKQFRAVRPDDYSAAARTLPWVSNAGTTLRWTGSWLTMFTTVDPKGNVAPSDAQRDELAATLDRYRMAGRPVYTPDPAYAALDIVITVCAAASAQRGAVEAALLAAFAPARREGFFNPDRFTFGTPLYRSRLEAAIQAVPGVAGVVDIRVRRRGRQLVPVPMQAVLAVAPHEILRIDNDPNRPENGSIAVHVEGGR